MSVKGKIFTAAVALSLAGGVGAAATRAANAATSACGTSCTDVFSALYGTTAKPGFILDAQGGGPGRIGEPIILARASAANPGEDFRFAAETPVSVLYDARMVPAGLALRYGCVPGGDFKTCPAGAVDDLAVLINYTPDGGVSGYCVGVGATPSSATPVTLQECGVTGQTFWIIDHHKTGGSNLTLINGATANSFNHPYTLTAGFAPGEPLFAVNLYTTVTGTVLESQQWGDLPGAVGSVP